MKYLLPLLLPIFLTCNKEKPSLAEFREIALPVKGDAGAVCFVDSLHGLLCGGKAWESGYILSSQDGGLSWMVDTLLLRKMEYVGFDPGGQAYACGQDMLFFRPPEESHWQLLRIDFQWLRAAHFPSRRYGATVSGEGFHSGQLRVFGPGDFWQPDTLHQIDGELESLWYADSATIVAVGAGWVIRSDDAGQSWERLHLSDDFYYSVHFPTADTGYICGHSGSLLKTVDKGRNWQTLRCSRVGGPGYRAVWFTDADKGWLVGDNGIFRCSTDGGKNWRQVADAPADVDYTDVYVRDGRGWATGKGGRLFRFRE